MITYMKQHCIEEYPHILWGLDIMEGGENKKERPLLLTENDSAQQ